MIAWLAGTFVATNALIVAVLTLREPVRRHFGPAAAYALWLLPAARSILPSFTETVTRSVTPAPAFPAGGAHFSHPVTASALDAASVASVDWPSLFLALWLAGAAILLVHGIHTFACQRRAILAAAVDLARIGSVRLVRSESVVGPVAFGILDRVIAVPLDFDQRFTPSQRRLALDHELAHHRSGDLVANLFAFVLLCLQWFNPLAWAAHVAFRFDQEAACDARVLDKANNGDRLSYGTAIAKAASGPAFLTAGALDRPSTLSRRLTIMTRPTNCSKRRYAFLGIGVCLLALLPLTATTAVTYIDVSAAPRSPANPAPLVQAIPASAAKPALAAVVPATAVAPLIPAAAVAPSGATDGDSDIRSISRDSVWINGREKRWEELTPQERAHIRAEMARARKTIDEQLANLPRELAKASEEALRFRNGDFKREMAEARETMRRSLASIEANSRSLRAHGEDPERLASQIRESLREVENMDIDKIVRESIASIDVDRIRAQVMDAGKSLDEIEARLDQLDRR
jgi:beta-lactamase regulating signal transducer with metallopeptidase domain